MVTMRGGGELLLNPLNINNARIRFLSKSIIWSALPWTSPKAFADTS
jgi:hypothetical protein